MLAAVAVPGIAEALAAAGAQRVYVCNLFPQVPETEGYDVAAHVAALREHGVDVDVVLWDSQAGLVAGDVRSAPGGPAAGRCERPGARSCKTGGGPLGSAGMRITPSGFDPGEMRSEAR